MDKINKAGKQFSKSDYNSFESVMNNREKIWKVLNRLKPVSLIAASTRPGVDFVHSLFDKHPQILTFDGWLLFHEFYYNSISVFGTEKFIVGLSALETNKSVDKINIKNFFSEFAWTHLHKFDSRYDSLEKKNKLGPKKNEFNFIPIDQFVKYSVSLMADKEFNSRNALLAVYAAFSLAKGEDIMNKTILLHQAHLSEYVPPFAKDFPGLKVIACVRDPRVYATKVKNYNKNLSLSKTLIIASHSFFRLTIDGINELINIRNIDVRVNILEKLHKNPKKSLQSICDWLSIDYNSVLMTSTWNGKNWLGDSLSKNIINIFDEGRYALSKKDWKKDLSLIDKIIIESLMKKEMENYNYKREYSIGLWFFFVPLLIILPTKHEIKLFYQTIKEKKYILMITIFKIILLRYYFSYRKYINYFVRKKAVNNNVF
jgi:hypothetical protein